MTFVPVNKTEAYVLNLCQRSVLSLWCYNNPRGKEAGKELCDILVVCDPHVIIISVKEVLLGDSDNADVDYKRWERKAVTASIKQIGGADRWLSSASHVIRSDGSIGLKLPDVASRKVHRIAVAFGSRDEAPIQLGDTGKGFVHVMNETSFHEVLTELDTIADLVDYLAAKETCVARGCAIVVSGPESNLLGWYLFNGRSYPTEHDMIVVGEDVWQEMQLKPEFKRRKEADRESYYWDRLIELLSDPKAKPVGEAGEQLSNSEIALRTMAKENRFSRRGLGAGVREFFERARANELRSRILRGPSGIIYVFVYFSGGEDDEYRVAELASRCFIARYNIGNGDTVVGVGITKFIEGMGSASDLILLQVPNWSAADDDRAQKMKADLGFFRSPQVHRRSSDEYPSA